MSANHNGSIDRALQLIDAAAEAGADAVKLQTYTADTLTLDCERSEFQITKGPWKGRSLHELYDWAHTPWDWHPQLFERAQSVGLDCFSSPFDVTAVDFLQSLDCPAMKIASFELVDHGLIAAAARTGRPMLMSTGMATDDEIAEAMAVARASGAEHILVLHCVSGYPTPLDQAMVQRVSSLQGMFGVPVGLSDHTLGSMASIVAVAMGACLIEKHMTLRRSEGGPDAEFSLEPSEFSQLCADVREAWEARGADVQNRPEVEASTRQFRRSLFVVEDLQPGDRITTENVRSIRPGDGLPPKHLEAILGRGVRVPVARGTPVSWDLLEGESGH
ncbi:MAG: pseudaminic acid synthase [Phycisphaerales bacterium]|nr:pseudaminic acid synthase [Phycisphaerales bacterium]